MLNPNHLDPLHWCTALLLCLCWHAMAAGFTLIRNKIQALRVKYWKEMFEESALLAEFNPYTLNQVHYQQTLPLYVQAWFNL